MLEVGKSKDVTPTSAECLHAASQHGRGHHMSIVRQHVSLGISSYKVTNPIMGPTMMTSNTNYLLEVLPPNSISI
jgi:hypothetical protein